MTQKYQLSATKGSNTTLTMSNRHFTLLKGLITSIIPEDIIQNHVEDLYQAGASLDRDEVEECLRDFQDTLELIQFIRSL